jgi:HK97 family phage prohead protease
MTTSTTPPSTLRFASPLRCKANLLDRQQGITEQIVNVTGHKDSVGDTIVFGAFEPYLANPKPKGVWHHDWKIWVAKTVEAAELKPNSTALKSLAPDLAEAGLGGLYIKAQYNLDTDDGRRALSNVLFFEEEAEYSIGYDVLDFEPDGDKEHPGWLLKAVPVWEWSPVLFGANELTRTLSMKSRMGEVPDLSLVRSVLVQGLKSREKVSGDVGTDGPTSTYEPAPDTTRQPPVLGDPKAYADLDDGMIEGSHEDLRGDLRVALYGRFTDADWICIEAVMPDAVICSVWPMDYTAEPDVFRLGYSIGGDGEPVLADADPEPVTIETVVTPKRSPRGLARKLLDGEQVGYLDRIRARVPEDELAKAVEVEEAHRKDQADAELLREALRTYVALSAL